jgi:hypothetical protein
MFERASTPRDARLKAEFPEIEEKVRLAWIDEFYKITFKMDECGAQIKKTRHTLESFSVAFKEIYPWMDSESLTKSYYEMNYMIFHEGYDI